jgi:hypothetical protein
MKSEAEYVRENEARKQAWKQRAMDVARLEKRCRFCPFTPGEQSKPCDFCDENHKDDSPEK